MSDPALRQAQGRSEQARGAAARRPSSGHYSYALYADPATARGFDEARFGGPIGELVAEGQAAVVQRFLAPLERRTIVDVGTGTGRAAMLLARAGAQVTGVDASEEMLTVARQRALAEGVGVSFRKGDAHKLDFPDRSFDAAVSLRVLLHTPAWRECVAELCRVANRLIVVDYVPVISLPAIQSVLRRLAYAAGLTTEPYRVFTHSAVTAAFAAGGFRIRERHQHFVLPISLHRALGSRRLTQVSERLLERIGLLRLVGSPVTIVAERCESS